MLLALADPAVANWHVARFDVEHDAAGYRVDASADVPASRDIVWQTLTDYEHLPRFIPGLRRVKVLRSSSTGAQQRLLVEQVGELRFFFFTRRVAALLDIVQEPATRIVAHAVPRPRTADDGDATSLNAFEGTYTLQPLGDGVRLRYRAQFAPGFSLPPLVGPWVVRWTLQAQFEAMLAEIERRRAAATSQAPAR